MLPPPIGILVCVGESTMKRDLVVTRETGTKTNNEIIDPGRLAGKDYQTNNMLVTLSDN